jgi:hypothetical protein
MEGRPRRREKVAQKCIFQGGIGEWLMVDMPHEGK